MKRVALVSAIGFLVADAVAVLAGTANLLFMIASIAGGLFFLALLSALVRWWYLRSQLHAAQLDAELDAREAEGDDGRP